LDILVVDDHIPRGGRRQHGGRYQHPAPRRRCPLSSHHAASRPRGRSTGCNGQQLAWIYARATEAEARQAKVLTMGKARRTALGIAKLSALLRPTGEED
jgi:hypothetical protein